MSRGNRQALPAEGVKVCASCGRRRGTLTRGWEQITRAGDDGQRTVVGYTCPDCPGWSEPIRREVKGGGVRWVAVVGVTGQDGKRRQHKRRHDTLDAARAWVAEVRDAATTAARQGQSYADPSLLTVRALCDRWLSARAAEVGTPGGIREVTVNGYRSALHGLLTRLGHRAARDVTPGDVEAALRSLAADGGRGRPLSHRTLVYGLGALRQAYAYGQREDWVTSNPAAAARAPRADHAERRRDGLRWSPAEVARFRAHADEQPLTGEPWIRVGMRLTLCGLRRSEVLGLDWSNVDLDAGTVVVVASRVKTGQGSATALGRVKVANSLRSVQAEVLHPGTARALRELWMLQGRPEAGLVILDGFGEPLHPDAFSRRFRALCSGAGVPVLRSVHNVRHSLATALQVAGVPDHEGAALLGHDVATYRRFYLATDDDGAAAAAAVAGRLFAV